MISKNKKQLHFSKEIYLNYTTKDTLLHVTISFSLKQRKQEQAVDHYSALKGFILFYFILFYFILFYFILFYFILFYSILFYFIFARRRSAHPSACAWNFTTYIMLQIVIHRNLIQHTGVLINASWKYLRKFINANPS